MTDQAQPVRPEEPQRYELPKRLERLEKRVAELETLLIEAFEFIGDEMRPIFGQQHAAACFDAVAKRLRGDDE